MLRCVEWQLLDHMYFKSSAFLCFTTLDELYTYSRIMLLSFTSLVGLADLLCNLIGHIWCSICTSFEHRNCCFSCRSRCDCYMPCFSLQLYVIILQQWDNHCFLLLLIMRHHSSMPSSANNLSSKVRGPGWVGIIKNHNHPRKNFEVELTELKHKGDLFKAKHFVKKCCLHDSKHAQFIIKIMKAVADCHNTLLSWT